MKNIPPHYDFDFDEKDKGIPTIMAALIFLGCIALCVVCVLVGIWIYEKI